MCLDLLSAQPGAPVPRADYVVGLASLPFESWNCLRASRAMFRLVEHAVSTLRHCSTVNLQPQEHLVFSSCFLKSASSAAFNFVMSTPGTSGLASSGVPMSIH